MTNQSKMQVLMMLKDKLDTNDLPLVEQKLNMTNDSAVQALMMVTLYDKLLVLCLSFFLGAYSAGRFYIKDFKYAIIKLVVNIAVPTMLMVSLFVSIGVSAVNYDESMTGVVVIFAIFMVAMLGLSIWNIVDVFFTYKRSKMKNLEQVMMILNMHDGSNDNNNNNSSYNNGNYNNNNNGNYNNNQSNYNNNNGECNR